MRDAGAHLNDDQSLDLLHGLTEPGREGLLLEHLAACAACEARFRELAGTHERGRARAAALIAAGTEGHPLRLVESEAPAARPLPVEGRFSRRVGFTLGLGLAAAAAIAFLLLPRHGSQPGPLSPRQLSPRQLAGGAPGWLPDPQMDITLRAEGAGLGDSLRAGLGAYARRDLATARRLLARPLPEGTADDVRRIYLADVELRLRHAREALEALDPVLISGVPQPWRNQAHWTQVRAFDALGRQSSADSVLRLLALETGEDGRLARESLRNAEGLK